MSVGKWVKMPGEDLDNEEPVRMSTDVHMKLKKMTSKHDPTKSPDSPKKKSKSGYRSRVRKA